MNRLLLLGILYLLPIMSFASNNDSLFAKEVIEGELQIRQKPGTEPRLARYLASAKVKSDTVFALLYAPSHCPRCETAIPAIYDVMKSIDSTKQMILITVYRDSIAAKNYNMENGYKADGYVYDTNEEFRKIFSFNMNDMYGLFTLKIVKSTGELIIGGDVNNNRVQTIRNLINYTSPMKKHVYASRNKEDENFKIPAPTFEMLSEKGKKNYIVETPKENTISFPKSAVSFENGKMFFCDELSYGIKVYAQNNDKLVYQTFLQADSVEKTHFVKLPADVYAGMLKRKSVYFLPISSQMSPDGKWIDISYSLPDLSMEKDKKGNINITYYNAPAILRRNSKNFSKGPMSAFDFNPEFGDFAYFHFKYTDMGDKIIFACQKYIYPLSCPEKYYRGIDGKDPFLDSFYGSDNPFMAAFDTKTGKLLCRFGQLDEYTRRAKLGYFFVAPLSAANGNELAYTDSYSGKVFITTTEDLTKAKEKYSLYEIDWKSFPEPDTTLFYKKEYAKAYNRFLYRKIEKMSVTKDYIYCIVRYGMPRVEDTDKKDNYVFAEIDRKTGRVNQYRIPKIAGTQIYDYGLTRTSPDTYRPFSLIKEKEKLILRVF